MQKTLAHFSSSRFTPAAGTRRLALLAVALSAAAMACVSCRSSERAERPATSRPNSAVDQMARDDAAPAREALERDNQAGKPPPPPPPPHDYRRGSRVVDQPGGIR
jgi:type IV secretory pathway VirB10-like protein